MLASLDQLGHSAGEALLDRHPQHAGACVAHSVPERCCHPLRELQGRLIRSRSGLERLEECPSRRILLNIRGTILAGLRYALPNRCPSRTHAHNTAAKLSHMRLTNPKRSWQVQQDLGERATHLRHYDFKS